MGTARTIRIEPEAPVTPAQKLAIAFDLFETAVLVMRESFTYRAQRAGWRRSGAAPAAYSAPVAFLTLLLK